jgi:hypothetical protein
VVDKAGKGASLVVFDAAVIDSYEALPKTTKRISMQHMATPSGKIKPLPQPDEATRRAVRKLAYKTYVWGM